MKGLKLTTVRHQHWIHTWWLWRPKIPKSYLSPPQWYIMISELYHDKNGLERLIHSKHKTFVQHLYNAGPTSYKWYTDVLCLLGLHTKWVCHHWPGNMGRCWTSAGLMSGQRRRRWSNIRPTLVQRLVFAGWLVVTSNIYHQTFAQCWFSP